MRIRGNVAPQDSIKLGALGVGGVLALWWLVTSGGAAEARWVSPLILPTPFEVLEAFPVLHYEQGLLRSVVTSLVRVTLGFLAAIAIGVPLGVSMAVFTEVRKVFEPLVAIAGYTPIPALLPLSIAWWGLDEGQKVGFLTVAILVALVPLVIASIDDVEDVYLQTGYTLGATRLQAVTQVLLPIAAPRIWDGLRAMYGVGWSWIIMAEVANAQSGLGFLIQSSQRRSQTGSVYAVLLVIVVIAVLIDAAFRLLGKLMFPFEED